MVGFLWVEVRSNFVDIQRYLISIFIIRCTENNPRNKACRAVAGINMPTLVNRWHLSMATGETEVLQAAVLRRPRLQRSASLVADFGSSGTPQMSCGKQNLNASVEIIEDLKLLVLETTCVSEGAGFCSAS